MGLATEESGFDCRQEYILFSQRPDKIWGLSRLFCTSSNHKQVVTIGEKRKKRESHGVQ
jgi:hypothetical protein